MCHWPIKSIYIFLNNKASCSLRMWGTFVVWTGTNKLKLKNRRKSLSPQSVINATIAKVTHSFCTWMMPVTAKRHTEGSLTCPSSPFLLLDLFSPPLHKIVILYMLPGPGFKANVDTVPSSLHSPVVPIWLWQAEDEVVPINPRCYLNYSA